MRARCYVVYRESTAPPEFAASSSGGWFKGRDPSVGAQRLKAEWVPRAQVLYIGEADIRGALRRAAQWTSTVREPDRLRLRGARLPSVGMLVEEDSDAGDCGLNSGVTRDGRVGMGEVVSEL